MLDYDLYNKLLDKLETKAELSRKANLQGLDVSPLWNSLDDSIYYYGKMNDMEDAEIDDAKFLACADYLTSVPYGSVGYKTMEEKLAKDKKNLADVRFEKLASIMGEGLTSLPQEQVDFIKNFFRNYNREDINLSNMGDVLSLLCRVYHECESAYKKPGYKTEDEILDRLSDFVSDFTDLHYDQDKVTANEVLREIPKHEKLNESEVAFAEESLGLNTPANVKEQ